MFAMTMTGPHKPLSMRELPMPESGEYDLTLAVLACGICRTDLHVIDGDLPAKSTCNVPGHEIIGRIVKLGSKVSGFKTGDRVGVPWLGRTCGHCRYCLQGQENLCDMPTFTGYDRNGGFAQFTVADARYCFLIPDRYDDIHAAPLLCAGLIGYRAYRMCGNAKKMRLGLYGFGAAAHLICQIAAAQEHEVYAFFRPGDQKTADFALKMGACWAGPSNAVAPFELDAAIIFAPDGKLVPQALQSVRKGGIVVCAGIHMSDIPSFPYTFLWGERTVKSVANLTREDGLEFFATIERYPISTHVKAFPLSQANQAIEKLRRGEINGAAVLVPGSGT